MKPKNKLFGFIEYYINEFRGKEVEFIYGKNSYIRVHTISESLVNKSLLVELIIILGDTINEEVLDTTLAEILIENSLVYFYSNHTINVMIRWDV